MNDATPTTLGGKVLYFAYGANRDPRMMEAITGSKNLKGKPAVLEGFKLVVQRLDQLPDMVFPTAPAPVSPQAAVAVNWSEDFTSYNIKEDPNSKVAGTLWELSPHERDLVRDWELVDFGWYEDKKVTVRTDHGLELNIQTEGFREGQEYDHEVDGMNYETWLNLPEDFDRIATANREAYLERLQAAEGSRNSPEAK